MPESVMRAKLRVASVVAHEGGSETVKLVAVGRSDAYPADGSDEDNTYAKFSPSADVTILIANPNLRGLFKQGDKFYTDFTRAPE